MNNKQATILKISAVIAFAMLLFPPFQFGNHSMGYGFLLSPPKALFIKGEVNFLMLLFQWLVLGAITAVLFNGASSSKGESGPPCPDCGGTTVKGARKCKNCGSWLVPPSERHNSELDESSAEAEPRETSGAIQNSEGVLSK